MKTFLTDNSQWDVDSENSRYRRKPRPESPDQFAHPNIKYDEQWFYYAFMEEQESFFPGKILLRFFEENGSLIIRSGVGNWDPNSLEVQS